MPVPDLLVTTKEIRQRRSDGDEIADKAPEVRGKYDRAAKFFYCRRGWNFRHGMKFSWVQKDTVFLHGVA